MAVRKTSSSLVEVVDHILNKDIVVNASARVSMVGIELLALSR